ncbi:MAG TPA: M20 family metallo-hydrolase [Gaiellaceae bacterium]|nr:M20 family metallo-hydrolase [Gaiellaceae bacterium]
MTETLDELATIGRSLRGGTTRVAWSDELFRAYDWIGERMRELGLEVEIDPAGNLIGRWNVGIGKAVGTGSHLDTVPSGGRLDGAFGVVGALHAVALLQEEGFMPSRPLWVMAFMDEEGTRFNTALFGSQAFTGAALGDFADRADADGTTLRAAMAEVGRDLDRAGDAHKTDQLAAFVEMHIEQGPLLESEGLDIGVVTSIVGLRGYRVHLYGQANHAGTTPMRLRRDALAGAARVVLELREFARLRPDVTANIGKLAIEPGGANVIPGVADFTIDVRAATPDAVDELDGVIESTIAKIAAEEQLEYGLEAIFSLDPLELDAEMVDTVERAAVAEGARWRRMPSGAGHDAMLVGRHVPTGMIFVPSRDGISHSPEEFTSPDQLELGTRVLAAALRDLLRTGG